MATPGERLGKIETWIEGHEDLCQARDRALSQKISDLKTSQGREIRDLKDGVGNLTKGAWGLVLAVLAWTAAQVWDGLQRDRAPPAAVAAVSVQHPPK